MTNHSLKKSIRWTVALLAVLVFGVTDVYAGTAYSDGRAYLRSSAYYGHSAMPKTSSSSNYRIYTTSSSATRSMGFSGGGASSFGGTVSSPSATPND